MLRCLIFGVALCLPVALDAQTNSASASRIEALQSDMRLVKQKFLELLTDMDDWTDRINALEVENHLLKKRLAELETGEGDEDLYDRVTVLEELAIPEDFVAKLEGSMKELQSLDLRLERLEARIGTTQAGRPAEAAAHDSTATHISAQQQPPVARTDDNGRLISVYRREIDTVQAKNLVAEADCETVGKWFDERFPTRDYNAFFARSDRGVRVCERLRDGWRSLRAGETRRAHVITVPH